MSTPPNTVTELPPSTDDKYYIAIGRFIIAYASTETAAHMLARRLSGIRDDKARLLFSGMRLGDVISRIRALLKISKRSDSTKRLINDCLDQFDLIGTARDKMVHRVADYRGGKVSITNMYTAKSILNYEKEEFALSEVYRMEHDCWAIYLRFAQIGRKHRKGHPTDKMAWQHTWRYKPASPKARKKQSHQRSE